jgi:hypothetical protein
MPAAEYYAGLSLAEALEKMGAYHHDPDVRHISTFESDLLQKASIALAIQPRQPLLLDEPVVGGEFVAQVYRTGITSAGTTRTLSIETLPMAPLLRLENRESLLNRLAINSIGAEAFARRRSATPLAIETSLAALLAPVPSDRSERLQWLTQGDVAAEDLLSAPEFELVNRALYQKSIPTEESPRQFKSILDLAAQGLPPTAGGAWVSVGMTDHGTLLAAIAGAFTFVLVRAIVRVGDAVIDRFVEEIESFGKD